MASAMAALLASSEWSETTPLEYLPSLDRSQALRFQTTVPISSFVWVAPFRNTVRCFYRLLIHFDPLDWCRKHFGAASPPSGGAKSIMEKPTPSASI
jgi:hypothetical protein